VREATFNALGSLGVLEDATVLDLFAGTGAMGIEALSRGAAHATFVDHDPRAVAAIRTNLDAAGFAERADVVRADAVRHAATAAAVDLAVLDPPYAFDAWPSLLAPLPAALAVVESDRDVDPGEPWAVIRSRRYGSTVVTIVRREVPA